MVSLALVLSLVALGDKFARYLALAPHPLHLGRLLRDGALEHRATRLRHLKLEIRNLDRAHEPERRRRESGRGVPARATCQHSQH